MNTANWFYLFWVPILFCAASLFGHAYLYIRFDTAGVPWSKIPVALRVKLLLPVTTASIILACAAIVASIELRSVIVSTHIHLRDWVALSLFVALLASLFLYRLMDGAVRRLYNLNAVFPRPSGGGWSSQASPYLFY